MNNRLIHTLRAVLPAGLLAVSPASARAQDPPPAAPATLPEVAGGDTDKMAADADAAWNKGDWATAAANYQALLDHAKKANVAAEKLEQLYFFLGAAYFNIPMHDKALEVFNEYITKYPKGANIFEANLAVARALRAKGQWAEAIKKYEPLKNAPPFFKDDVNMELAQCYKENQQMDKAFVLLETALAPGVKTLGAVRQALVLVDLYLDSKPEKGVALLERIKRSPGARPMVMEINFTALKLADQLMADKKEDQALQAYQNIRKKKEILDTLTELIADYEQAVTRMRAAVARKGPDAVTSASQLERAGLFLSQAKAQKENLEKEKNYDAVVFYRISRCFAQLNRFWEARLGFRWLYENFKDFDDRATVLFGLVVSSSRLVPASAEQDGMKLGAETEDLCRKYLSEFPNGANSQQVAEVLIAQAQKSQDAKKVNDTYEEVMKYLANSPNKAQFLAVQVQNYLEQMDMVKAREAAEKFRAAAPGSPLMEDIDFMHALTYFFENKYNDSIKALGEYIAKYPTGKYLPDARYRLANLYKGDAMAEKRKSKGADSNFNKVIEECQAIIREYPGTPTVGVCRALIADCYKEMTGAEMSRLKLSGEEVDKRAADAYVAAATEGAADDVIEYGLSQARPLLISQGRWKEVEELYRSFLKSHPNHRTALEAVNWIGKAIVREGKTPEEKEASQARARRFLADTVLENINNAAKEGVEDLLQQLAVSAIPKRKAAPAPAPTPGAPVTADAPPAARPAPPSPAELGGEAEAALDKLLGVNEGKLETVGKARLLFVKAELYRNLESRARPKKVDGKVVADNSPKKSEELMKQLVTDFRPEDMSPRLLASVGGYLQGVGAADPAAACFNRLVQFFPQSPYVDWGVVGLGDLAYAAKDYDTALRKYTQAIEEFPGGKYGEAMLGRSRVQYESEKYEDAEKTLKEMFGDKSYPPEVKAEVTWLLGEIRFKLKDYSEAFNYFQRLYLSFKKFPNWMARGYLRAGETKEALSKPADALDVYKDAVNEPRNADRMQGQADFEKIRARFRALGG